MSDAAFREKVFRQGVVVEDLKDKDGKPAGISVTWGDLHYWANPLRAALPLIGGLVFMFIGWVAIASSGRGQAPGIVYAFFVIGVPMVLWALVLFARRANERQYDQLRALVIRPDGRLEVPYGLPKEPKGRLLNARYNDVTNIQLSPAREWDRLSDGFFIILQTESGEVVFLGQPQRPGGGKAELQPIIVALHKAWEAMRPIVVANAAMAAAEEAMKSGATSFVVGDDGIRPAN